MKITQLLIGVLLLLFVVGCQQTVVTPQQPTPVVDSTDFTMPTGIDLDAAIDVSAFANMSAYQSFVVQTQSGGGIGFPRAFGGIAVAEAAVDDGAFDTAVTSSKGADFSETNVQVQGIDEGDLIKTDGAYIYTYSDQTLFIISAGEDAEILSKIELEDYPSGLFINGDQLVVYGTLQNREGFPDLSLQHQYSFVRVYDVSDRSDLVLEEEYVVEGYVTQARMKDSFVYVVTTTTPNIYATPIIMENGIARNMLVADIAIMPFPYSSSQLTSVHALDLDDLGSIESKAIVTEYGQHVYMSEDNLYIAHQLYINEWEIREDIRLDIVMPLLRDVDLALIQKIENTDSDVLSAYEKEAKIMNIVHRYTSSLSQREQDSIEDQILKELKRELDKYDYFTYTVFTRIALDGTAMSVEASGRVPGSLNNQFAMDEDSDVFRVATTVPTRWSSVSEDRQESSNHVYTLDMDLDVLDSVVDIAPGESIFSTRFIGDRLYMVTFRQVDPFFVIDLSDAEDIEILGELKIPGFSRYLHPYDEDHIIGFGRDATEEGRQLGLKISIFDVSDVFNPVEKTNFVLDNRYSSSVAEFEHKAFLFSREKELLVVPAYSWSYDDDEAYNGALVFKITADDVSLRGLIDHSSDNRYGSSVERSLYIDDLLYTKSRSLFRVNEIDTLEGVQNVSLKTSRSGDIEIY